MTDAQMGIIGGVLGSLIGLAGGVIGSYYSIKNTRTPEERAFMVQAVIVFWLAGIALVILPVVLEVRGLIAPWWRWVGMTLFLCGLGPMIAYTNRRCNQLGGQSPAEPAERAE
jgi:drug/metabolite transporter (DMT)-like permease